MKSISYEEACGFDLETTNQSHLKNRTMLITKTITRREEIQVEIKTPSYYKTEGPDRWHMICEDGSIVYVGATIIVVTGKDYNKSNIADALAGKEITEDEFMAAYDAALKNFEVPMFPEALKIKTA